MQNLTIKAGTVDVSCVIRIVDSTDGTPETGVTSATSGIDLQYRREGAVSTAITESDLTNLNDAHSDGGMKHIGNGYYRLDLPDAACAAGAAGVLVHGTVTGMVVVGAYINLTQVPADVTYISGDATAADNLEALFDGTGYEPVIGNGVNLSGVVAKGTLSGTHSATTADLGTSAPANDISGMTLYFPDDKLSRVIDSYNTGTGVATFSPSVAVTLTNGDNWVLYPSPPYSTGTVPNVNVAQVSGDATAADNLEAMLDGTGSVTLTADVSGNLSGSVGSVTGTVGGVAGTIQTLDALDTAQDTQHGTTQGTLSALVPKETVIGSTGNDTTHIHIPAWTYGDDEINSHLLVIGDNSTGEVHCRWIEDWVNSTALATVATLPFTPQDATDYVWLTTMRADVTGGSGLDAAGVRAAIGMASANLDTQLGSIQTDTTNIEADTQDIQSRIPAALVGGRIDATVDATGMEAGAVSAIQSGLATSSALATAQSDLDTLTGSDGVTLATSQPNYAPAVAGDEMDLVDAPNATAVTAIQSGLATPASILTTALTESYAADGAAGTLSQILYAIQAFLQEKSVSGTTMTVKKLDGSTTAMTFTLDDGTTPTSITRSG